MSYLVALVALLLVCSNPRIANAAETDVQKKFAQCLDGAVVAWIPENQPENRFKGEGNVPDVPPEIPPFVTEPFVKLGKAVEPSGKLTATFNPAAFVVKDAAGVETVYLVVRGETDQGGDWKKNSLPYLFSSTDGLHFKLVQEAPLFEATEDYNRVGGIEDTRYMDLRLQPYVDPATGKTYDGAYMYTAYDGKTARVAARVFNHSDPTQTVEVGLLFPPEDVAKNPLVPGNPGWNKSPSGIQIRDPLTGKVRNILYVGEGDKAHGGIMALESDTPFGWKWPADTKPVVKTEPNDYSALLREAAFQPVIAKLPPDLAMKAGEKNGIVLSLHGDSPPHGYQVGFVIFSLKDPTGPPIYISHGPYLSPDQDWEIHGQVGKVVFASGGVFLDRIEVVNGVSVKKRMFYIYYGAADKFVGVAAAPAATGAGIEQK